MVVGNTEVGPSFSQTHANTLLSLLIFFLSLSHCLTSVVFLSGIEVKFKNMIYPVILAPAYIAELNTVTHTDEGELMLMSHVLTASQKKSTIISASCATPVYESKPHFIFVLLLQKARFALTDVFLMTFC